MGHSVGTQQNYLWHIYIREKDEVKNKKSKEDADKSKKDNKKSKKDKNNDEKSKKDNNKYKKEKNHHSNETEEE
jgi:hypothetical protein